MTKRIHYVTSLDGWGDTEPTAEDQSSFCAYVVHRLEQAYPGRDVTAEVDPRALDSQVTSNDNSIDCAEVCSYVGNDVWSDWCGGARAPDEEAASAWASDSLSIDNGNTFTTVADLSDADVQRVIASASLDREISDRVEGKGNLLAARRSWLAAYCAAHIAKFGQRLVFG